MRLRKLFLPAALMTCAVTGQDFTPSAHAASAPSVHTIGQTTDPTDSPIKIYGAEAKKIADALDFKGRPDSQYAIFIRIKPDEVSSDAVYSVMAVDVGTDGKDNSGKYAALTVSSPVITYTLCDPKTLEADVLGMSMEGNDPFNMVAKLRHVIMEMTPERELTTHIIREVPVPDPVVKTEGSALWDRAQRIHEILVEKKILPEGDKPKPNNDRYKVEPKLTPAALKRLDKLDPRRYAL